MMLLSSGYSYNIKQPLEPAGIYSRFHTNLFRETDNDLTEAGTPLSHASWLELLPTRQPSSPENNIRSNPQ